MVCPTNELFRAVEPESSIFPTRKLIRLVFSGRPSSRSALSVFDVTVLAGDEVLDCFQFDTELNTELNYIGVWSRQPFDRIQLRKTTSMN